MLVGDTRKRVKPGTLAPREDDTFHMCASPSYNSLIWFACLPVREFRSPHPRTELQHFPRDSHTRTVSRIPTSSVWSVFHPLEISLLDLPHHITTTKQVRT